MPAREGRGRKPIFTEAEEELVQELIEGNPRSLKIVVEKVAERTGKRVSIWTIKGIAKKFGMIWKRIRKSLKTKRNNEEFQQAKEEIKAFEQQEKEGKIEVRYVDEAAFNLVPCVPYAWQKVGRKNTLKVPSSSGGTLNVLGFLGNKELTPITVTGSIDSRFVIACFDYFCTQMNQKTVVVLDNSPVHTSKEFVANIARFKKQGLFPYYLPTYAPELNKIERLWKEMKYRWLPFSAYKGAKQLRDAVEEILIGYGNKYIINFS